MSFAFWINNAARITDDATGDLVADMKSDKSLPAVMSKVHLYRYLIDRNASSGALREVGRVWGRYKNWTYKR